VLQYFLKTANYNSDFKDAHTSDTHSRSLVQTKPPFTL